MTIQTSYLAAEAVGAIMQDAAGGFTIRNTSQGVILRAWLPGDESLNPQIDALRERFAALPAELLEEGLPTIELSWVDEENWAESWKSHWRAVRLGRRIVVKPSWQPWPPEDQPEAAQADDLIVELDPGMAFGTGAHATTALCLAALEDFVTPGMEIVDLGCGSGILTVAALKLGAKSVRALDTDILAVEATARNCEVNGVTGCDVFQQEGLSETHGQFDLIVGNISQKIIKLEAPLAPERLKPGGIFITSGFYIGYEEDIIEALCGAGFEVVRTIERDMWACVIGRKKG
ncbi:MAG: 50S ribosomal protein L11 methyltransferase [Armatimonadota bacterium]